MIAEGMNMKKRNDEANFKKYEHEKKCAKMVPKNPPVFSQKTNTNTQTYAILTCVTFFLFPNLKSLLKGTHFQSCEDINNKMEALLKALSQNDLWRYFRALKAHMQGCITANGNYFEGDNVVVHNLVNNILF
jgi:hypothetical protein